MAKTYSSRFAEIVSEGSAQQFIFASEDIVARLLLALLDKIHGEDVFVRFSTDDMPTSLIMLKTTASEFESAMVVC